MRRRKAGVKTLKVKTKWTNRENVFSTEGGDGENKPLEIICEHKKAVGIKPDYFDLRGHQTVNILKNNQFYHAFII